MYRQKLITLVCKRLKRVANKFRDNDYFNKNLFTFLVDNIYHKDMTKMVLAELILVIQINQKIILPNSTDDEQYEFSHLISLWDTLYYLLLYMNDPILESLQSILFMMKHDLKNANIYYSTVPSPNSPINSK